MRGVLRSEGEVVLASAQACPIQILAPSVVVERQASIRLTSPLETTRLVVRGRFSGVVNCLGTVLVAAGGNLDADICARSIVVEKGGRFRGDCQVVARRDEEDAPAPARRFPFFMLRPSPTY
jgi:cytoskeletal protein CcmA (bactofilin family)